MLLVSVSYYCKINGKLTSLDRCIDCPDQKYKDIRTCQKINLTKEIEKIKK
jgi:hypothetical protein